ncbi:hypothetical protein HK103_002540 [Boothiomyces macroporosus]|uniref:Uncharacterized protein n=1 Tax=Boothiomyces macroporosus TaxID=261099 RepID=A0AAD5UIX9_9FUNG|nr:hypothetical protein HK103_002540 [Boothiomyces macroporosus]
MKLVFLLILINGLLAQGNSNSTQPSNQVVPTQANPTPAPPPVTKVPEVTNNPPNQQQTPVITQAPQVSQVVVFATNSLGQPYTFTNYITYYPAVTPTASTSSVAQNSSSANSTTFIIIIAFVAFGVLALAGVVFGVRMYVKSKDNERDFNDIFRMANNGHSSTPRIVAIEKGASSPSTTGGMVTEEIYFPTTVGVNGNNGTAYRQNSQQRSPLYANDGYYEDYPAYHAYGGQEYDHPNNYYYEPAYVAVPTTQVPNYSEDSLIDEPKIIDNYLSEEPGTKPGYPTSIFDQYDQQRRQSNSR